MSGTKKQIKTKHPCEFAAGSVSLSLSLSKLEMENQHVIMLYSFGVYLKFYLVHHLGSYPHCHCCCFNPRSILILDLWCLPVVVGSLYLKIPASEAAAKQSCSSPPAHPPYLFHNDSRLSCGLARRETTPWIVDCGLIWKTCLCCTSKMFKHGVSWVSCKIFPCPVLRDNQIIRCHKMVKSQFCWLHQGWNNQ